MKADWTVSPAGQQLRVAALVKQVPRLEAMQLGPGGRLVRDGVDLEMSAYCRRAVAKAVELAAESRGTCVVISLGPPGAEDVVREGVAWALARDVTASGLHLCDSEFAGSDTLATARALAAAVRREGPFDLILLGRNSVDAETGQVGPQIAELLGLPFVAGLKQLRHRDGRLELLCERDDGWQWVHLSLPAVVSVAERLCEPAKVDAAGRAQVPTEIIRRLGAVELGPGPWGQAGSRTTVGEMRAFDVVRLRRRLIGPIDAVVHEAAQFLVERSSLDDAHRSNGEVPARPDALNGSPLGVLIEPDRPRHARELLGAAARLANGTSGAVTAICMADSTPRRSLAAWGADEVVEVTGALVEEDVSRVLTSWAATNQPWAILAPSTLWGREVSGRAAARLNAGMTGDAIGVEARFGLLTAWKPAFGGRLVANISASSHLHIATVRPGVLPLLTPRPERDLVVQRLVVKPSGRVQILSAGREDDPDALLSASRVIGVGQGVSPKEYSALQPLLEVLGAELAATRKVTDLGWLPRSRQIGITGHSIAPRLYIALGIHGKFNHTVGVRAADTVLAVNNDPVAPIFDSADVGIIGDWREVVPRLAHELALTGRAGSS